jgi:hypothetical protein
MTEILKGFKKYPTAYIIILTIIIAVLIFNESVAFASYLKEGDLLFKIAVFLLFISGICYFLLKIEIWR